MTQRDRSRSLLKRGEFAQLFLMPIRPEQCKRHNYARYYGGDGSWIACHECGRIRRGEPIPPGAYVGGNGRQTLVRYRDLSECRDG